MLAAPPRRAWARQPDVAGIQPPQHAAVLPGPNNVAMVLWASFSPDGKTLAILDNYLYLWDAGTGRLTASLSEPGGGQVGAAALSPASDMLATSSPGTAVYLWHVS